MITGFNTDINHRGIVYHIQTEDRGVNNPRVETIIYRRGAILDTRRISYADIVSSDCLEQVVGDMMRELHEQTIREIRAGRYTSRENEAESTRLRTRQALEEVILAYLADHEPTVSLEAE
jgi:hypothetical protein